MTSDVVDIKSVIEEAGCLNDYAPNQVIKLKNILEHGGYKIIKAE